MVDALRTGAIDRLVSLHDEPIRSARFVATVAVVATPHLLDEPDADRLLARLVELTSEVATAAAGRYSRATGEPDALLELDGAFTSLTTHELRRPVATIRGYLAMIHEGSFGEIPEALQQPLRHIAATSEEMARLINSLALVARVEDGADALDCRETLLAPLVRDAVRAVTPDAEMKRVEITQRIDSEVSARADGEPLTIAIINLISNAIKYSPEGSSVHVALERWGSHARITVRDEGPGIPREDSERVFDRYYRSEAGRVAGIPGMGLGLPIVRRIAELHRGRVVLETGPPGGATFRLLLPLA
jgi:signal transduction histidine kinase